MDIALPSILSCIPDQNKILSITMYLGEIFRRGHKQANLILGQHIPQSSWQEVNKSSRNS